MFSTAVFLNRVSETLFVYYLYRWFLKNKKRFSILFFSFFFFLLRLFLCDQSGGSFAMLIISPFYSLSVQFYLAHVVFGLPCYKPRERNFLYSFFFFSFFRRPFGAATAAVDGTKREKNVLGFFFEEP